MVKEGCVVIGVNDAHNNTLYNETGLDLDDLLKYNKDYNLAGHKNKKQIELI